MKLASLDLHAIAPFHAARFAFVDDSEAEVRALSVVFGASGTGKTSLLSALATTRPGHALPPLQRRTDDSAHAVATWLLRDEEHERPHPLLVASPNAVLAGESADDTVRRRREQAVFDRRAQEGASGYALLAVSGARWFSRGPVSVAPPERTLDGWDVRAPLAFDDPTRSDLAKEAKAVFAGARVARALARGTEHLGRYEALDDLLTTLTAHLLSEHRLAWAGLCPRTLQPLFARDGKTVSFDDLAKSAKHLAAIAALTARMLHARAPGSRSVDELRAREAVVLIDDVERDLEPELLRALPALLRGALPNGQWIVTTGSRELATAADPSELVVLHDDGSARAHDDGRGAPLH